MDVDLDEGWIDGPVLSTVFAAYYSYCNEIKKRLYICNI